MEPNGIHINVKSEGVAETMEILSKLPAKVAKRPLQSTLRRAAKPLEREVQQNLPQKVSELKKAITTKNMRSLPAVKTGIYTKRVMVQLRDGRNYDAYYPLYWLNYGTLERRDPTHQFQKPVRRTRHLLAGIRPQRFVQKSYDNVFREVVEYAEANLLKDAEKFLDQQSNKMFKQTKVA